MSTVGIRALKQNASEVVGRAENGEIVTITRRGKPVARVVPIVASRLEQLRAAGLTTPATRRPEDLRPPLRLPPGHPTPSEILREMRDDERY